MDIKTKREQEKEIVSFMIALYCKKKHGHKTLCPEVHCYKKDMREKIREVMRFSGPRMMFYHPAMAVHHSIESKKEKKRMEVYK